MADPLVLETRVDRVTVYRNGALVVRRGELAAPATWPLDLRVPGLPLLFQSDTVRVRVEAPGVSAGPVEEEARLEGLPALGEDHRRLIEERRIALTALREEEAAWARFAEALDGLVLPTALDLSPRAKARWPDLGVWSGLTDAADQQREAAAATRATLKRAIRTAEEALAALERRAAQERPTAGPVTRGLRTTIHAESIHPEGPPAEGRAVVVEVEYFLAGARWAPAYHLDLGAGGQGRLALSAWVGQATGEDWAGAAISVSTADLRRAASLPKLPAWKIGRAVAPPPSGWRPLPEDTDLLFQDADRARASRPEPEPRPASKKRARGGRAQAEAMDDESTGAVAPPEPEMMKEVRLRPQPLQVSPPLGAARAGAPSPAAPPPATLSAPSMPPPGAMPARSKSSGFLNRASRDEEAAVYDLAYGQDEGGAGALPPPPPPPPPLTPGKLLDYAWLRLPRWDEHGRRGRLWPVDAFSDLRALAEERGDTDRAARVERALDALREATLRLAASPLPPGCVPIEGSNFQHRYPASGRASVMSDGRFVQVPVAEGAAACQTVFRVVPRQSPQAFRTVRLDNPLGAPLPAGPVRVTDRGDVRVAGTLGPVGAGGRISLDLGVEDGLRVARNATYAEAEKGMISAQSVGTNTVRTEILSRLAEPATVLVYERLPLAPEGGDLSVTLEASSREPTRDLGPDNERQEGALRWELALPARGKTELHYTYVLKLPAKLEVVGGARREP